jgi:hypothetical protein
MLLNVGSDPQLSSMPSLTNSCFCSSPEPRMARLAPQRRNGAAHQPRQGHPRQAAQDAAIGRRGKRLFTQKKYT